MPRPPPPKAALIATGHPCSSPNETTSAASVSGSLRPGTPATTPALSAAIRELILSPMISMASGGGPTNVAPAPAIARAKRGVLGEEAVPRMHRTRPAPLDAPSRIALGVQVALGRRLTAESRRPRPRDGRAARRGRGPSRPRPSRSPSSWQVRMTRTAISPRLAMSTLSNTAPLPRHIVLPDG